ncbi:MAG: thiamine pyrophosphate-binding protein [Pseudomonadota bacterium]
MAKNKINRKKPSNATANTTSGHLSVGEVVVKTLEDLGVTEVFGIPGNHTVELYRGLSQTRIRHTTTRHEQGATFMADGYARATGRPGVCFLISGPGFLNGATRNTQAQQDNNTLLVITTLSGSTTSFGHLHQMPDQVLASKGMAKAVITINNATSVSRKIREAYRLATTPSPGAVVVQVHVDVLGREATFSKKSEPREPKPESSWPGTKTVARALRQAKRPLILVGGGARRCPETKTLAERMDAPVICTTNGKGIVPYSHPLSTGGSPSLPCLKRAIAQADLVLALGTELGETDYDLLMNHTPEPKGRIIAINVAQHAIGGLTKQDHIRARVEDWVGHLLKTLPQARKRGSQRARTLRSQILNEHHYHADFEAFFDAIKRAAPDLILVGDSTRPTYYATWMYECELPGRYFHSVSGFGTLGYAIPAAFGARTGTSLPVVALIGDGGAQFSLTEIATAVDNKLGVPIIIWQNQGYEEITNSLGARGVGSSSTRISAPDYRKIAEAYGIKAISCKSTEGLTRAIRQTLKESLPSLILVQQDDFIHRASGEWYG